PDAFGEEDRSCAKSDAVLPGRTLHFDLDCIPDKPHTMERNSFQNFFAVANKTCSRVADGHAGNKAYIRAGEIGKQYTTDGPVDDIHTGGIPRTDGNVESEFTALEVECGQIFRIMGKVSVHLQNKFVTFVNGILKAGKVSGSQAQFPFTFDEMEPRIVSRIVIKIGRAS